MEIPWTIQDNNGAKIGIRVSKNVQEKKETPIACKAKNVKQSKTSAGHN
jgi:hypothetical protein